jgi:hypothetical protein
MSVNSGQVSDARTCDVDPGCPCGAGGDATHDDSLAQTWCDKCDLPAWKAIDLTSGVTAFRCSQHAWLIIAPRGRAS